MSSYAVLKEIEISMEPGDVLVKKRYSKDPISHAIQTGQAAVQGSKYANYVHAAIALDGDTVAESQGSGVVTNKITGNVEHGYKYKVFRYNDAKIAKGAADWASMQVERSPKYSIGKAFLSLFKGKGKAKSEESMTLLGDSTLFCSEFAADCFNRAAYNANKSAPIPMEADATNPSKLYGFLKNSSEWKLVGSIPSE
jgi:hypothetical protein